MASTVHHAVNLQPRRNHEERNRFLYRSKASGPGRIVGAIAVSGARPEQDGVCVKAAIDALA
jgi:hypothetical protein